MRTKATIKGPGGILSVTYCNGSIALNETAGVHSYSVQHHEIGGVYSVHISTNDWFVIVHSTGIIDLVNDEMMQVSVDLNNKRFTTVIGKVARTEHFDKRLSIALSKGTLLTITS